ncbi:nucleotidyltransferase [Enterococcus sp. LJL98]
MKACGLVVEYNPFHNGHRYHAKKAREVSQAEVVVAVMSGNFLQRGEPAILDKWRRAEAALENGVDLVVELPIEWAVQSADFFAEGAIALLQALACESFCFGTDRETPFDYATFGKFVRANQADIDRYFQENHQKNQSYPEKMAQTLGHFFPEAPILEGPNHLLGMSYSIANAHYPQPMRMHPIQRIQAAYHSEEIRGEIASATAIRRGVAENAKIADVVPLKTAKDLEDYQVTWQDFWPFLRYQLKVMPLKKMREIYQMVEGLEYRLKEAAKTADDFETFIQTVKTKRYSQARLQRLCTYVLLGITQEEVHGAWDKKHLSVLGMNEKGKAYLKQIKKSCPYPILSRIGKKEGQTYDLTVRCDTIYALANDQIFEQNYGRSPIIKKQKA